MSIRPYMSEPWFGLLKSRCEGAVHSRVAKQMGISPTTMSMVLNGTGPYGDGSASTARIADRVVHTFGRYECPHLTSEAGDDSVVITADQCRGYAHRPAPTASPRDMQHWQACRRCPHREASAPPPEKTPVPRKASRAAQPSQETPNEAV